MLNTSSFWSVKACGAELWLVETLGTQHFGHWFNFEVWSKCLTPQISHLQFDVRVWSCVLIGWGHVKFLEFYFLGMGVLPAFCFRYVVYFVSFAWIGLYIYVKLLHFGHGCLDGILLYLCSMYYIFFSLCLNCPRAQQQILNCYILLLLKVIGDKLKWWTLVPFFSKKFLMNQRLLIFAQICVNHFEFTRHLLNVHSSR